MGLRYTPASTAGFVTALYVVITPMLALVLLRTRVSRVTWVAAVLALGGVSVLSLDGFALGAGIPLLMASAFLYALHIVLLGSLVQGQDPLSLTALQMLGICAVLWPAALPGGAARSRRPQRRALAESSASTPATASSTRVVGAPAALTGAVRSVSTRVA